MLKRLLMSMISQGWSAVERCCLALTRKESAICLRRSCNSIRIITEFWIWRKRRSLKMNSMGLMRKGLNAYSANRHSQSLNSLFALAASIIVCLTTKSQKICAVLQAVIRRNKMRLIIGWQIARKIKKIKFKLRSKKWWWKKKIKQILMPFKWYQ